MRLSETILCVALLACQGKAVAEKPKPSPVSDAVAALPALPRGRVILQTRSGPLVFDVELALTPPSHERGLMFRKEVPEGTGMLFVFDRDAPRVFWMKNTLVPLDMLFLSAAHKIVGLIENAEPLTTTPRDPHASAKYVLELAGGTAFAKGIKVGDVATFEGLPGQ